MAAARALSGAQLAVLYLLDDGGDRSDTFAPDAFGALALRERQELLDRGLIELERIVGGSQVPVITGKGQDVLDELAPRALPCRHCGQPDRLRSLDPQGIKCDACAAQDDADEEPAGT